MMTKQTRGLLDPIQPPANRQQLRSNAAHKLRLFMHLLCREEGVSVAELLERSGWHTHTVRGFMSRISKPPLKLKIAVERDRVRGNHHYHLRSYRVDVQDKDRL